MKNGIVLFVLLLTAACDKRGSAESTRERAAAEEQAAKEVEIKNLTDRAAKMEADLSQRHRFYSAIEGVYAGTVSVGREVFNLKFVLVRSIPQFRGSRVRELAEVENDLVNLSLNVQVVQWHPEDQVSGAGCIVKVQPTIDQGVISISSPDCKNVYFVYLASADPSAAAQVLAQKFKDSEGEKVLSLVGTMHTILGQEYPFSVSRVQQGAAQ